MNKKIILFDYDGTVTEEEILPKIARAIGLEEEIKRLTEQTIAGDIPFDHSFMVRIEMLKNIPITEVQQIVNQVSLNKHISLFIKKHYQQCGIVTGNLDVWIQTAVKTLKARCFCSIAQLSESGNLIGPKHILRKKNIVDDFHKQGCFVIAVGDGNNDAEMIESADIGIAYGGVHPPAQSAVNSAQYIIYDDKKLCSLIQQLL